MPSTAWVPDLLAFLDASPSPYHAVEAAVARLEAAGFRALDEREPWALAAGQQAFVRRGGGTLVAFRLGARPVVDAGFLLGGAHSDSPGLRLKPRPDLSDNKYHQLAVEPYGGALWHTWLDRELSIAGRVALADGSTRLVRLPGAPCRLPSLAIHLDRTVNTEGLKLDPELHLRPLLDPVLPDRSLSLERLLAAALVADGLTGVEPADLLAWDLMLFDTQPAALAGATAELLCSARIDNLVGCHALLGALLTAPAQDATQVVALHDHEEVGSESSIGARSRFVLGVLERLAGSAPEAAARALSRSLFVSVDMAHALHPNHALRHDEHHAPVLGGGPVLKSNVGQSYATDAPAQAVFLRAARAVGVEVQRFASRNDVRCGSTLGPLAAARTGVRALDVGGPMLGMHSCRETCDTRDVAPLIAVLTELFAHGTAPDPAY